MVELKEIAIRGFKSIRAQTLAMRRVNLLIGGNGAGKSNFISFFRFLSWMQAEGMQAFIAQKGFGASFLFDGPATTPRMEARLKFVADQGTNEYAFALAHAAPDTMIFVEEKYRFQRGGGAPERSWTNLTPVGHVESRLVPVAEGGDATARFIRESLRRCIVHQFHNTSETSRMRLAWDVEDGRYLKEDGANLAAVLHRLESSQPAYYRRILDNIRQVTPQFAEFDLEPTGEKILLRWREKGTDIVFGPHQASDGTLRIMALFTLLLLPEDNLPNVIVMDEPELGLHPSAIELLAGLVKGVSRRAQVVIATQSPGLLNYFEPEDVVVVDRPARESQFRRLERAELSDWLERYGMADLWEKNVIGGRP
jgi:predicted ATPase